MRKEKEFLKKRDWLLIISVILVLSFFGWHIYWGGISLNLNGNSLVSASDDDSDASGEASGEASGGDAGTDSGCRNTQLVCPSNTCIGQTCWDPMAGQIPGTMVCPPPTNSCQTTTCIGQLCFNNETWVPGTLACPSHAVDGPVCVNKTLQKCDAWCTALGASCNATAWTSSCAGTWYDDRGYQTPVQCCENADCASLGPGRTCISNNCVCSDIAWSPDSTSVCQGQNLVQTSNCGTTRTVNGTGVCLPTVSIWDSPVSPTYPEVTFSISWNSFGATSCTLSQSSGYGAGPNKASGVSGTYTVPKFATNTYPTVDHTFTATCSNASGQASDSVTHTIINRPPSCGNGSCSGSETCLTCPQDCGACTPTPSACPNGVCSGSETCSTCPQDCGSCTPSCGDGSCNGSETCSSCPGDCGACAPTLSATLSASPSSGPSPLAVTLTASVSGTAAGSINYTFWWNCNNATNSVAAAIAACGDPDGEEGNANGAKFNNKSDNPKATNHTYSSVGTFYPKVIVERGAASPVTDIKTVTVSSGGAVCGDGACNGSETCSSCQSDCGTCGNNPPNPPGPPGGGTGSPVITQPNYCVSGPAATFSWSFSDPDSGDTQSAYQVEAATNSGFSAPSIVLDSGKVISASNSYATIQGVLSYNQTYYWRVRAWDNHDSVSNWATGSSFATPKHQYPTVSFSWSPQSPVINETTQMADQSAVFGGAAKQAWLWVIQDATYLGGTNSSFPNPQVKFASSGAKTASLGLTDSDGYSCTTAGSPSVINVRLPLPGWREIAP